MRIDAGAALNRQQLQAAASGEGAVENETPEAVEKSVSTPPKATPNHTTRQAVIDRPANIDEIIKAFQLPDTPQTREIIRQMSLGGIELSAENTNTLVQASGYFPELTPEQVVFMAREEMPINETNVRQFQEFLEHKNLVGSQLADIMQLLGGDDPDGIQSNVQNSAQVLSGDAVQSEAQSSSGGASAAAQATDSGQPASPQTTVNIPVSSSAEPPATAAPAQTVPEGTAQPSAQSAAQISPDSAPSAAEAPVNNGPQPAVTASTTPAEAPAAFTETPDLPEPAQTSNTVSESASRPDNTAHPGNTAAAENEARPGNAPPPPAFEPASDAPAKNVGQETVQPNTEKPQSSENIQTAARQTTVTAAPPQEQPAAIEEKIAALFKKVDPQNPHKLPRELNARELVRELTEVAETIKQKLPELSPRRQEMLGRAVAELEQSVKFLDNLSKFTPVVNIPLQWDNKRTTAELYVFNDGKGKGRIDPQNATAYVSLMTANAGRVEGMIKILGKNVECDFSLELPETADVVRGEMTTLYKLLDAQGFKLARTSAQPSEKARDIFDVVKAREQNKARYFFDRTV